MDEKTLNDKKPFMVAVKDFFKKDLVQYIVKRLLMFIPTLFLISVLAFFVIQLPEIDYVDREIAQKLIDNNLKGEAIGVSIFATLIITGKVKKTLRQMREILVEAEALDSNGYYELDLIAPIAEEKMKKFGGFSVVMPRVGPVNFSDKDVSALKRYIEG